MKKYRNKIILGLVVLGLSFVIGSHFYNKKYHENIKRHPIMFCYENFRGGETPVSVLIIEDLDLKDKYISYYKKLETGVEPSLDNAIPLKGMPQYEPVYVMGYTSDSLLADVVSYYDRGKLGGGSYLRGWVYSKALHKAPPLKHNQ